MAKAQYIDNVILDKDLFRLYKDLLDSPTWCLSRSSIPNETYGNFPGKVIKDNNQIFDPVWNAYFSCLSERINQKFFEKYDTISIVGFLTPVWEKVWGGELYVEEEKIDFVPGRFVIFQSERIHNGAAPTKDLHWWRISVNYTLSYD